MAAAQVSPPPPPEISAKPPETLDLTGVAYDSYLHGCTVYLDLDGSQSFTPGSDPHTTALNGIWALSVPASLDISSASIQVVADEQCTNVAFNTTLLLPLAAPLGSSVVATLPTLLYHILRASAPAPSLTPAAAEAVLKSGLGISLPPGPSLTSLDAISLASVFPAAAAWQQLLRAEAHVSNAVLQLATLMSLNTSSVPAAARFVFAAMAKAVINAASTSSSLNFTNTGTLAAILDAAVTSAKAQASGGASSDRRITASSAAAPAPAFVPNSGVVGSGQLLMTSAAAVANIHRVIDAAGNVTAIFKASYIGHTLLTTQLGQLAAYANAAAQLGYSEGNVTQGRNDTGGAPIQAQLDSALLRAFSAATEYSVLLQAVQTAVLPGPIIPSLTPAAPSTPSKLPPPPPSRPPSLPRGTSNSTGDSAGSPPDDDSSWAQTHKYILAGIIVGGCTAVAALLIALYEYIRYRKHKQEKDLGETPWRQQPDLDAGPPAHGPQEQMRMAGPSFAFSQAGVGGDARACEDPLVPGKEPVYKQRRSTGMRWISNDIFGRSRGNSEAAEAAAAAGTGERGDTASVSASLDRMGHLGQGGPVSRNIWQAMVRSVLHPVYFTRGVEAGADGGTPEQHGSTGAVGDSMARSASMEAPGPDMGPLRQQLRPAEGSMPSSFPPPMDRPGSFAPQPGPQAGPQSGPPSSFTPQTGGPSPSFPYQDPAQPRRETPVQSRRQRY